MADEDLCIACKLIVTTRQEALQCDGCQKWQHRVCNTGISRAYTCARLYGPRDI